MSAVNSAGVVSQRAAFEGIFAAFFCLLLRRSTGRCPT